jgi:uncharacterized protein YjbI with pentapeptide repeats
MNSEEAWSHFMDNYALEYSRQKIMELERCFSEQFDNYIAEFLESFREICRNIQTMQRHNQKGKIACITYSMLRTAIVNRKPVYLIEAFNKDWYLDFVECQARYRAEWAFGYLQQLETELEAKLKLYLGQINSARLQSYLLQEAAKYHQYVIRLARYAIDQAVRLPEFQTIARGEQFAVRVGEYLDASAIVYKEDRSLKDLDAVKAWFDEKKDLAAAYGILNGLDLAGGDYWGIDLQYTDLRGSDLSRSYLPYSALTGAKFNRSSLMESDLSSAWIFEADFSEADLRGADLSGVVGAAGIEAEEEWLVPGYRPVNFQRANLKNVSFKAAKLRGALFNGANLTNVNFEGADLEGAVFAKENNERINLDEAQRQRIVWV